MPFADGPEPPAPNPEMMLFSSLIFAFTKGDTRKMRRIFGMARTWLVVRRMMASAVRIRHRRFDAQVKESCDSAIEWIDRTAPLMVRITPHVTEEAVQEAMREFG